MLKIYNNCLNLNIVRIWRFFSIFNAILTEEVDFILSNKIYIGLFNLTKLWKKEKVRLKNVTTKQAEKRQ